MITFFLKRIQQSEVSEKKKRTKIGLLAGTLGLLTNLVLFIAKIVIGLISGSVSIMADAINSLTDTASSLLTLIGFRISSKPADQEHPYGHERFETISGLFISIIMTYVGFQFLETSFQKILSPSAVHLNFYVFIVLAFSIGLKVIQGRMYLVLGNSIQSGTLKATAKDSFNDVFITLVVMLSAGIEWLTGLHLDGYMGLFLALYILYSGSQMIKEFVDELMGNRPSAEEVKKMENHLDGFKSILGYHDLLVHSYGPSNRFASVHIEVDETWSLNEAHQVIDQIEKEFKKTLDVDLVCHVDPVAVHDETYRTTYEKLIKIVQAIKPSLAIHDFRISDNQTLLQFDVVVPENCSLSDQELGRMISRGIAEELGQYQVDITFDHNYLLD